MTDTASIKPVPQPPAETVCLGCTNAGITATRIERSIFCLAMHLIVWESAKPNNELIECSLRESASANNGETD